jgi:PPOX class probable F420-dependent enzyme
MPKLTPIPASHLDLLERPYVAALATTLPNGTPQVTAVWFIYNADGTIAFNSAAGRLKDRAIRANPYVALMVLDPSNPLRYIQVRGPVVEISEEGAAEHMDTLSQRYDGKPFNRPPGQVRVRYLVAPEHVDIHGS